MHRSSLHGDRTTSHESSILASFDQDILRDVLANLLTPQQYHILTFLMGLADGDVQHTHQEAAAVFRLPLSTIRSEQRTACQQLAHYPEIRSLLVAHDAAREAGRVHYVRGAE